MIVDVWLRRVADVPDGAALLDPGERTRLAGLRSEDKQSYAAGHVLLRRAVARVAGDDTPAAAAAVRFDRTCSVCGEQHGRPTLPGLPGLHVSLSRTRTHVAVALAEAPVGVDLELVAATCFDGFDSVALHPDDLDALSGDVPFGADPRAAAWVRKEAALKALGTGLRKDPAGVRSPLSGIPTDLLGDGTRVTVRDVPTPWPTVAAAVAVVES